MNDSKEHIIDIALKLFLQKNFKEVTMKEIVDKTGLSKGAFYHYFESKEKLFEEIVENLVATYMDFENYDYSRITLYEFYHFNASKSNFVREQILESSEESTDSILTANFYSLMFDAIKLVPGFKEKIKKLHEAELKAWISVIANAKKNHEIQSLLSDQQIASMFIYIADGIALQMILGGKFEKLMNDVITFWDKFYESLKV
jgi:AcrR family transcriptional regulator